jgi:hypothetical protein
VNSFVQGNSYVGTVEVAAEFLLALARPSSV